MNKGCVTLNRFIIILLMFSFPVAVLRAQEKETEKPEASDSIKPSASNNAPEVEVPKVEVPKVAREKGSPYYDSTGKRDPFKPFIKVLEDEKDAQPQVTLPPIKRYSLEEFRLTGIMSMENQPRAMIIDPEKNTYVLGVGDEIGNKNGKITEIRDNGILVVEKTVSEDVYGEKRVETTKSVLAFRQE